LGSVGKGSKVTWVSIGNKYLKMKGEREGLSYRSDNT
jgi:hypothetical protein